MITRNQIDMKQGEDEQGREFGYVVGEDGGFFFTWHPTLAETLDSIECDEVDGDGGLDIDEVRDALSGLLASQFE